MFISSLLSCFSFQVSWILIPYNLFHLQLFNVMILLLVYNIKDFQFQITIFFYYPSLWYQSNKSLPNNAWGLCLMICWNFTARGFMFRLWIHFLLLFVCGFDNDPTLTFCRWMDVQFAQSCLLKVLSFLPWMALALFGKSFYQIDEISLLNAVVLVFYISFILFLL